MDAFTLSVEAENTGRRLDQFIAEELDAMSRNAVQKLIEQAHVLVNQKPAKANYKLRQGDLISVFVPEPENMAIEPEPIPLDIAYEDTELIVINKPRGMVVHPAPGHYSGTLVNALLHHCGKSLSGINGVIRPGIVHRIDKDTSGLLVAAKTNTAHNALAEQLATHSMARVYDAIVLHNIKKDEGTVDKPLARSPKDRKKIAIVEGGRRAVTHYTVQERFGSYTYIKAQLETGRTHQIRVHMASLGHPLLGDQVYGPEKQPLSVAGQMLHAGLLGFRHPVTNATMEFTAPLPEDFASILEKLRRRYG